MDALKKSRTVVFHEYLIDHATNLAEVSKALTWASTDWEDANPGKTRFDDTIKVRGYDDGVLIWWEQTP